MSTVIEMSIVIDAFQPNSEQGMRTLLRSGVASRYVGPSDAGGGKSRYRFTGAPEPVFRYLINELKVDPNVVCEAAQGVRMGEARIEETLNSIKQ